MRKKVFLILGLKSIFLMLLGLGISCSRGEGQNPIIPDPNGNNPIIPNNPSQDPCARLPQPGTGALFFQAKEASTALKAEREDFLAKTLFLNPTNYFSMSWGNLYLTLGSFNLQPEDSERPTLLAAYNHNRCTKFGNFSFLVRFPAPRKDGTLSGFLKTLPTLLQEELQYHRIETIDLFFAPQFNTAIQHGESDTPTTFQILSHFWRFPKVNPRTTPSIEGSTCLGIYEPQNHPSSFLQIGKEAVPRNSLKNFSLSYHDGAISPNNAHIGLANTDPSFSFYSLAYEPIQQRAAVTLHWVLTEVDYNTLYGILSELQTPPATTGVVALKNSLSDLIAAMKTSGFQRTPIFNALQNWLTPSGP